MVRIGFDERIDEVPDHRFVLVFEVSAIEYPVAQGIDNLPLGIVHIVVFEEVLADGEVLCLDPFLRPSDGFRDQRMRDDLSLLRAELIHYHSDALGAE